MYKCMCVGALPQGFVGCTFDSGSPDVAPEHENRGRAISSTPNCPYGIIAQGKHAPREHYRDGLLRQLELSRFGHSVNTSKDVVNSTQAVG